MHEIACTKETICNREPKESRQRVSMDTGAEGGCSREEIRVLESRPVLAGREPEQGSSGAAHAGRSPSCASAKLALAPGALPAFFIKKIKMDALQGFLPGLKGGN